MRLVSTPKPLSPARASPESLRRMRLKASMLLKYRAISALSAVPIPRSGRGNPIAAISAERKHELAAFSSQPFQQYRVRHRDSLKHGGKEEAEDRYEFQAHLSRQRRLLIENLFHCGFPGALCFLRSSVLQRLLPAYKVNT